MSLFDSHTATGSAAWGGVASAYQANLEAMANRAAQREEQKQAWQDMQETVGREVGRKLLAVIYAPKQVQLMALLRMHPKVIDAQFTLI